MGIDLSHPDLRENLLEAYFVPGMDHPTTRRNTVHGTSVAGLIAADTGNGIGIAGLAPGCKIVPALVRTHSSFRQRTRESSARWNKLVGEKGAEAIRHLVDRGCKVVNCSFNAASIPVSAFEYAVEHDVVVVIASGNFNMERPGYPAAGLPGVLCVGGVMRDDQRWVEDPIEIERIKGEKRTLLQGSNYGEGLNVVAPIHDLVLCVPEGHPGAVNRHWSYEEGGATSCAAPMGSALVALIRSLRPDLDNKQVVKIVEQGADDIAGPGWDKYTGWGRLNFYNSLTLAQSWPKGE